MERYRPEAGNVQVNTCSLRLLSLQWRMLNIRMTMYTTDLHKRCQMIHKECVSIIVTFRCEHNWWNSEVMCIYNYPSGSHFADQVTDLPARLLKLKSAIVLSARHATTIHKHCLPNIACWMTSRNFRLSRCAYHLALRWRAKKLVKDCFKIEKLRSSTTFELVQSWTKIATVFYHDLYCIFDENQDTDGSRTFSWRG